MSLFHKAISFFLSLAVFTVGFITVQAEPAVKRYYGDIDNNGVVDVTDARMVLRMAAGIIGMPSEEVFLCADIDRNNTLNYTDARLILRMAADLEPLEYMNSGGPGDTAGLLNKFNTYRSRYSLTGFSAPDTLSAAAATLAEEYYQTGDPALRLDRSYWFTAVTDAGLSPLFADAAFYQGAKSSDAAYSVFSGNAKTLKNLKYDSFNTIGIGCYEAPDGYYYWCVIFANIT